MGDQEPPEDKWRPLPKREKGWGFVSICSPSGLISEVLGKPAVGFINRADRLWKVDLDSYQLLDLAARGHSELWLRDRLQEHGMDRARYEAARDFAVGAGLLVRYGAADGTMKGRRCFAGLTIRRRGYGRREIENDRVEVVTPDGVMKPGRFAGGWSAGWDGKALADCAVKMLEAGATLPNSIWWPFFQALRSLELGLMWLDGPVDKIGTGLTDNCGHWIRPGNLWKQHGGWVSKPGNLETAWDGWNMLDRTVLSVATAVPMGNCHGDAGFDPRDFGAGRKRFEGGYDRNSLRVGRVTQDPCRRGATRPPAPTMAPARCLCGTTPAKATSWWGMSPSCTLWSVSTWHSGAKRWPARWASRPSSPTCRPTLGTPVQDADHGLQQPRKASSASLRSRSRVG